MKNFLEHMENAELKNPEPSYITADSVISQETATTLMALVDDRGVRGDWSYNPDCIEFQFANPFSKTQTQNDEQIVGVLPELFGLGENFLRLFNFNFNNTICETATGYHGFWVLKYLEQGSFATHCDWDSSFKGIAPPVVGTVCISLNDDFEGGEVFMADNRGVEKLIKRDKFSALMWDGWTQHSVAPITQGRRYALVIHYTGNIK